MKCIRRDSYFPTRTEKKHFNISEFMCSISEFDEDVLYWEISTGKGAVGIGSVEISGETSNRSAGIQIRRQYARQ